MFGSTLNIYPITAANERTVRIPVILAFRARLARSISPRVVARDNATFGPSRGAMTMAPIITGTLFCIMPMAATTEDNNDNITKTYR